MSVTDGPKCSKAISTKFQHRGHVKHTWKNMSTVLKPGEISFGVLFFRQILRQFTDVFEIIALAVKVQ